MHMKKRKPWTKFRHKVITFIFAPILSLAARIKYGLKIERFAQEGKRSWLILANHQTDLDQFYVAGAFRQPVYYVAMEDMFSMGFISKALSWTVAPIPFMKGSSDIKAVMNCLRVAKEGGTIALFPEGNRTYSGRTCYIKPAVAAMAKKMGLPIAIFRIDGGYGVKPRWAKTKRKGPMTAGVTRVIEPEEYKEMTAEQLYELICRELWTDESREDGRKYVGKDLAEGLERVLYVCPDCGFSEFESEGDLVGCKRCGRKYRYRPDKQFEAPEGETPFRGVGEWYDYQEAFIRGTDLSAYDESPLYTDRANLYEVIVYDKKRLLEKGVSIQIFGNCLRISGSGADLVMPYSDIKAMTCVAGHKLNIFCGDKIYQLKGDDSFNALKYCNIYYHAKFTAEKHEAGDFEFLGL